ncbi:MAG TPA: DUF134 domain-containing protein [Syntrophorhabdaceae bacterium]|nr:DUF134 domain-containing protein [Syntrophorhabdaceae bacterium]HQM81177.1 DUF134 domain-containing protein [Syntrophorhabdaceae bacterium]
MSRPKKCRCVNCCPDSSYFKPRGVPFVHLEEVSLNLDELEAIRLADLEGLYHEEAAGEMNVSRATFGRILDAARRKVAEAIVNGKALKIEEMNRPAATFKVSGECGS